MNQNTLKISLSLSLLVIISCKAGQEITNKYNLKPLSNTELKLSNEAAMVRKYYYTITNSTLFTTEGAEKKISNSKSSETSLIYKILPLDSMGNKNIQFTFDKIHAETKKDDEENIYDADNAAQTQDRMDLLFAAIKGSVIKARFDGKGNFISSTGTQEINAKVLAGLTTFDESEKKFVTDRLASLAGDEFAKQNFGQLNKLLPDTAVYVGSSWTVAEEIPGEISFKSNTEFVLSEVEGDLVTIKFSSIIKNGDKNSNNIGGDYVHTDISGKQNGSMTLNLKTNMLMDYETLVKLEGEVVGLRNNAPITIVIEKKIRAKKL